MVDGTNGMPRTVESLELAATQRRLQWKRRQDAIEAKWAAPAKRQCQSPMPNAAAPVPERTGCRCCERVVVKSPFVESSRRDTEVRDYLERMRGPRGWPTTADEKASTYFNKMARDTRSGCGWRRLVSNACG